MGKQVNFFMTFEDECAFFEWVRKRNDCVLIREISRNDQRSVINSLSPVADELPIDKALLVRVVDLENAQLEFIPNSYGYFINAAKAPAVQWSRCRVMSEWLAPGRLWFEEQDQRGFKKDESFIRWANSILSWVRRTYRRLERRPYYVGPIAQKMAAARKLQLGSPLRGIDAAVARNILGLDPKE